MNNRCRYCYTETNRTDMVGDIVCVQCERTRCDKKTKSNRATVEIRRYNTPYELWKSPFKIVVNGEVRVIVEWVNGAPYMSATLVDSGEGGRRAMTNLPENIPNLDAPHPWRIETDWTVEVLGSDGTLVEKFMTVEQAQAFIDRHESEEV